MKLDVGVYNAEWMRKLFNPDGTPITVGEEADRSKMLAEVINAMRVDFLGIVEGPDTLKDGSKTAAMQLNNWVQEFGLNPNYKGVNGTPSNGQQELCALYDSSKIDVAFTPTIDPKNQFDQPFLVDTMDRLVQERYAHFRPPLELTVRSTVSGDEFAKIIVAHTKSKGIFAAVDMARHELISERDRMRLFAECMSIRNKCDDYIEDGSEVIVMGDINDGIGRDYYENRFSKSAVEILLGNVWEVEKILSSVIEKPQWGSRGWRPSSSDFTDRFTRDRVNVLIDHVLASRGLVATDGRVWNPYERKNDPDVQAVKEELKKASDHFPVTATIENPNVDA